jgi:hypothetical protein
VALRDRTTEASLIRRVESLTDDNHRLREFIQQLRDELQQRNDELAIVHGELRQTRQQRPRIGYRGASPGTRSRARTLLRQDRAGERPSC